MAYIGFNPVPNISLGDMENLFDIENELAIISDTDTKHSTTTSIADKDKIAKQFMLNSITTKETEIEQSVNKDVDKDIEDEDDAEEDKLDFDIDEEELEDTEEELELDISEDDSFDIDIDDLIEGDTEEEIVETIPIKVPAKQQTINIDRREEELLGRIKIAEENKRVAEEKRIRLNKLEEEALKAEQEALRIKELHEQERKQSEFIRKDKEAKEDDREKRKREELKIKQEEEKKEKLKRLIADKQKQELIKNKQSRVASINSTVSTDTHNYDRYNSLDIDALYSEVREFLKINGVQKKATDTKILEAQFGKVNIKKLILKSYLISLGKGVTIGK